MRIILTILLVMLVASCIQQKPKIKTTSLETSNIKEAYIRTTNVEISDEPQNLREPQVNIIIPKNNEVINGGKIIVKINLSNFKLVTPDRYPSKRQGYVRLWFDDAEFQGSSTEFIFENESNGFHTIKAELMMSNGTVLPGSKTIKVYIKRAEKIIDKE